MKKFLFVFIAAFLSVPVMARVCMRENPTTLATNADRTNLNARIAALDAMPPAPPVDLSWLSSWISASSLNNSSSSYVSLDSQIGSFYRYSGTWSVTANHGGTGFNTAHGIAICSDTNGGAWAAKGNPSYIPYPSNGSNCWCKMTIPRIGAWVFGNDYSSASTCVINCASDCANNIRYNSTFRAAVMSLP